MSRWEDDNDNEEFWTNNQDEYDEDKETYIQEIEIDIFRQQEIEIADKQLNIQILDKAVSLVKGNWFFWIFSGSEKRMLKVQKVYEMMMDLID